MTNIAEMLIKIIECCALGEQYENLLPGSEHEVVVTPNGRRVDNMGVWVMGVSEPVKVLTGEYEAVEDH